MSFRFWISIRSGGIHDRTLKWSEIDPNFARYWPQLLWGGPQKCWDLDYQIQEPSDHMAKFRGDRPTELGDLALKQKRKKETSAVKHKSTWNYRSGWPNYGHTAKNGTSESLCMMRKQITLAIEVAVFCDKFHRYINVTKRSLTFWRVPLAISHLEVTHFNKRLIDEVNPWQRLMSAAHERWSME